LRDARRQCHETPPAAARLRVFFWRFPGDRSRGTASTAAVPRALAGPGAQGGPRRVLLAVVAARVRGDRAEREELPEADQTDAHHPRAGYRGTVPVPNSVRRSGYRGVPGSHALAVRRPRLERMLLRLVPSGRRRRYLADLLGLLHRLVRRLRVRHVHFYDQYQVSDLYTDYSHLLLG